MFEGCERTVFMEEKSANRHTSHQAESFLESCRSNYEVDLKSGRLNLLPPFIDRSSGTAAGAF